MEFILGFITALVLIIISFFIWVKCNNGKDFYLVDYKGKHHTIQDCPDGMFDFVIGKIEKKDALKKEYIQDHKYWCNHYGIPSYIGNDEDMKKVYK